MHVMDQLAMCSLLVEFHPRFAGYVVRVAEFASAAVILDSENF
jgi:hypothetical protein